MKFLLILVIVFNSSLAFAMDFESMKKKYSKVLRPYSLKIFGDKTTKKLLGEDPDTIKLPAIPKVNLTSTTAVTLEKNSKLALQGEEFNKLSDEEKKPFRIAFLEELFLSSRKNKASDQEIHQWLNTIEQGSSREGVYRAMVLDRVYRSLEDFFDPPSTEAVNFIQYFYSKYINKKVNADTLTKLNLYSIKRIISEKCLEILEAYESKPTNLYTWYGVMSADLAKRFKGVYKNKMRNNLQVKNHIAWASSVPYQHVKSEMVIKIHLALNSFMNKN
jgi:hypothetical protein